LGRVSRTAESSLKEASLTEASEFKVPFNLGGASEFKPETRPWEGRVVATESEPVRLAWGQPSADKRLKAFRSGNNCVEKQGNGVVLASSRKAY
jgi:hypothetical protein